MSNHFSAANLKSPGDDPRLDLTDLYVFPASDGQDSTVLIIDANPFMADGSAFNPDAVYRINVDNDGDIKPDIAFSFMFSAMAGGQQTATAVYGSGRAAHDLETVGEVLIEDTPVSFGGAAQPVQAGPVEMFVGKRSDPFFADIDGALHGFSWTGQDSFAGKNVMSIALKVPDAILGGRPGIGVWATTSVRRGDGTLVQMDRGGNPTINPFVNPDSAKDEYNSRQPAADVDNYLEPWSRLLQGMGGYPPEQARAEALTVLPDILHYDRTRPAGYPNGRHLTDDVFSDRFAWLSNGQIPPDGLVPHDDLMPAFPYLGPPNA